MNQIYEDLLLGDLIIIGLCMNIILKTFLRTPYIGMKIYPFSTSLVPEVLKVFYPLIFSQLSFMLMSNEGQQRVDNCDKSQYISVFYFTIPSPESHFHN